METFNVFFQKYPKRIKGFFLGYIVFAGCFTFPFGNESFPLDFMKVYLVLASYFIIGLALSGVYGGKKGKTVYLATLAFTIIGLLCRFALEYGEVSNTMNFTAFNILSYLLIVPLMTLFFYMISLKYFYRMVKP